MILKRGGDDGELGAFKKLWHLKWNKDHDQKDFDPFIDPNDNGGNDGAMEEEVEECVEKDPTNVIWGIYDACAWDVHVSARDIC